MKQQNNPVMMQYFEWYLPADGTHWERLAKDAQHLQEIGISSVWLPPAFKGTSRDDVGYGVYDLFDLGEFDQNGTVETKYGAKAAYLTAINRLKEVGIQPIADVVLNHKANGDGKEPFMVRRMNPDNRQEALSEPYEIEGYTLFNFPGRQGQYSDFQWHWYHFTGVDYDARHNEQGIFQIQGENKGWADGDRVDDEMGNYDYLMYSDIDYSHPDVVNHTIEWAKWFIQETGIQGFRMDAVKHIDNQFLKHFVEEVTAWLGDDSFYVFGEYWNADYTAKEEFLEAIDYEFDLVDVKLHMNFFDASKQGGSYDLRRLFDDSLMQKNPWSAVTFVDNHDTQEGQALASWVEDWFKPMAYGTILLHRDGYPTVFYGDYYGIQGNESGFQTLLDRLLWVRQSFAYGDQVDYLDDPHCIGWTRAGKEAGRGLALVMTNTDETIKRMQFVGGQAGQVMKDALGHRRDEVVLEEEGWGNFPVDAGSISVWVIKDAT